MSFQSYLKRIQKKHYSTVRAFAKALDIDPSHLSRAMGQPGQSFDVRGCLRLAQVTGESPSVVLRAAGKADLAALIESLYGAPQTLLTPEQQELLTALDAITDVNVRHALLTLAKEAARTPIGNAGSEGGEQGGGQTPPPPPKEPNYKMGHETRRVRMGR